MKKKDNVTKKRSEPSTEKPSPQTRLIQHLECAESEVELRKLSDRALRAVQHALSQHGIAIDILDDAFVKCVEREAASLRKRYRQNYD